MIRLIPIAFLLFSCGLKKKNTFVELMNKVDRLQINYTDSIHTDTTVAFNAQLKSMFQDVFEGSEEHCRCKESGMLRFYSKNVIVLVADFSIHQVDVKTNADCEFLFVVPGEGDCYRLNHRTGMYLDGY